jgi:hypothetical protein
MTHRYLRRRENPDRIEPSRTRLDPGRSRKRENQRKSENVSSPHPALMTYAAPHNGQQYARSVACSKCRANACASFLEKAIISVLIRSHFRPISPAAASWQRWMIAQNTVSSIVLRPSLRRTPLPARISLHEPHLTAATPGLSVAAGIVPAAHALSAAPRRGCGGKRGHGQCSAIRLNLRTHKARISRREPPAFK